MVLSVTNIKYSRKKIEIQFNSTLLVIEQNNYITKIVNFTSFMIYIISQEIRLEILH